MSRDLELGDMQGLLVRGYANLPVARFDLFEISDPGQVRRWLATVTDLVTAGNARPDEWAVNVALTATAFRALEFDPNAMSGFSFEFLEGMTEDHRSRVLGDVGESAPDAWEWGGPASPRVDILLLIYARDEAALAKARERVTRELAGASLIKALDSITHSAHEHFGFRDGISQPTMEGLSRVDVPSNTIKAGEFILGYQNEYGLLADRPLVDPFLDRNRVLAREAGGSGLGDFGRNGSYLVLRQLSQDVGKFWRFADRAAGGDESDRVALAAKMVGRWPSGAPLVASPHGDDPKLGSHNDFGYHAADSDGLLCPHGAHVRRSHPRDSLDPDPGSEESIAVGKRHRILRRGRPYGDPLSMQDALAHDASDNDRRGLFFMCLNANLGRQFEFLQHTWLNNPKFAGLYEDPDPIVGAVPKEGGTFRIPSRPVRRRIDGIPSFTRVRGGAYFFVPGIRALRYLAATPGNVEAGAKNKEGAR